MRKSASPPAIRNRSQNSENQIRFNKVIIYITECCNKKMTKCSPHRHKTAPSLVPAAHLTLWPHFCLAGELNNLSLRCAWSPCGSCPLIPALSLLGLAGFPSGSHSQNTAGWMTAERGRLLCTASISICANMILLFLSKKKKASWMEISWSLSVISAHEVQIQSLPNTPVRTGKSGGKQLESLAGFFFFLFMANTQICITVSLLACRRKYPAQGNINRAEDIMTSG